MLLQVMRRTQTAPTQALKADVFKQIMLVALLVSGTVPAEAALLKSYDFNDDLSDSLGSGVDLTSSGGTVSGGRYHFTDDQGLELTSALASSTDYAIEVKLQANDALSAYQKLIDFQQLTSDSGLYTLGTEIIFYVGGTAAGQVFLNSDSTVGLERARGELEVFLNGSSILSFADSGQGVPASNVLNFSWMTLIPVAQKRSLILQILFESMRIRRRSQCRSLPPCGCLVRP